MQVDKGIRGSSWDVADLFHSDLFSANNNTNNTTNNNNNNLPSSSSSSAMSNASSPSSREATPLPTPPSISLGEHFPDPHHASSSSSTFQSPDALYGFYDSSPRASTSADARELLAATGPKFPSSGFTMGGAPNPFNGFPSIDEGDFAAYMHALTGHSSPSQSHSTSQQGSQPQPGMEMMYGFNGMDLEMMNLPMSLDGSFALPGSANPFTGIPMMGMPIDSMGMSMNIGIDPQLVDSPAPLVTMDDEDSSSSPSNSSPQEEEEEAEEAGMDADDDDDEVEAPAPTKRGRKKKADTSLPAVNTRRSTRKSGGESPTSPTSSSSDQEKLTLTIAPVKVGGRGTALGRRGTVLSGGVSKRGTAPAASSVATSALGSTIATPLSERSNTPAPAAPAKRGRKPGPKKALEPIEEVPAPVIAQQQQPVTSTSSLPVLPASLPPAAPTHTRTGSTSKSTSSKGAVGPGGVPHSSSGLGIVPPPLPNGQKHLTPVDLGLGKTFAFAIPMGTFNGGVGGVVPAPGAPGAPPSSSSSSFNPTSLPTSSSSTSTLNAGQNTSPLQAAMSEFGGDDDDEAGAGGGGGAYPADWRPSPEVFAKMSSKEKRQLRNKISARNFRVRRKEYISTLEGDIAERDRLLEAIRNELGSSRNENVALRREVENLKRVLLNGRGVDAQGGDSLDNLPPPAPLPEKSAAEMLAAQAAAASASSPSSSSALFRPNTQKDLATSPRNGQNSFWGGSMNGVLGGGGVTAVHTTFVPAPVVVGLGNGGSPNLGVFSPAWTAPSPFAPASLQENMNPLMRSENMNPRIQAQEEAQRKAREVKKVSGGTGEQKENSFEGFADSNMFTMKNMDTYRMHLWGKMAAQYHAHHQQQQQARAPSTSPSLPHIQTPYLTSPYGSPQSQSPSPQSQGDATANIYHPNLFQLQQLAQQQQQMVQNSQLQGLAARMGRSWFNAPTTPNNGSANGQGENRERVPLGPTTNLVALLSGKGSVLGGSSYSSSTYRRSTGKGDENKPVESAKGIEVAPKMDAAAAKKQAEQAQAAMLAVVASQTILKKLGQAFWDAFSGSASSSSSNTATTSAGGVARRFEAPRASGGGQGQGQASGEKRDWDADKVRKVLDGTAVLRIVDVDQLHKLDGPVSSTSTTSSSITSKSTIPVVKVSPPLKSNSMPSSIPTLKSSSPSTSAAPTIKQESDGCSTMGACWAQCAGEWCSTETLRNVSKGGSVSVPASPALRPATVVAVVPHPGAGLKAGLVGKEQERKMAVLLEEGMKGLRL